MDLNMISALLKMLGTGTQNQNNAQECGKTTTNTASVFAMQNGLGEQVNVKDTQKSDMSEILKSMSDQNPMLALLSSMQNSKGDLSTMLPLLTSLLSTQKIKNNSEKCSENATKNDEKDTDFDANIDENITQKKQSSNSQNDTAKSKYAEDTKVDCNNIVKQNDIEKTQRHLFSPIAFAGYKVMSDLCYMLKSKHNPCR